MAVKRYRIPGLQVPSSVSDDEVRAFFHAIKERLELISGERGDPEQRGVSVRELREAGIVGTSSQNRVVAIATPPAPASSGGSAEVRELDFTSYPLVPLNSAGDDLHLLAQGLTVQDRFRVALQDFLSLFARLDQESEFEYPVAFRSETHGFEIIGPAPRFRFTELSEDSDDESSRPADENVWDIEVDESGLSVWLVSDDEETRERVLHIARTGTNPDSFDVEADELLHNGEQVLVYAGAGLVKEGDTVSLEAPTVVTPDQLEGDEDDYDPGEGDIVRLSSDDARSITGMVPGNRRIHNVGAYDITLVNDSASSAAENRFAFMSDIVIPPNGSVVLWYDSDSERHRCEAAYV